MKLLHFDKKMLLLQSLKQVQQIAQHFSLKHDARWFKYISVPREIKIILEYAAGCPEPDYNKFGTQPKIRARNINSFLQSRAFKKHAKQVGGQVYSRKNYLYAKRMCENIKDEKFKREFIAALKKIKALLKNSMSAIIITKVPKPSKKYEKPIRWTLRHEFAHVLFSKNNISFQKKYFRHWKYDEGIVTYCEAMLQKKLAVLEKYIPKYKNSMYVWYVLYAIKFRELLKSKKTPKERGQAVLKLLAAKIS